MTEVDIVAAVEGIRLVVTEVAVCPGWDGHEDAANLGNIQDRLVADPELAHPLRGVPQSEDPWREDAAALIGELADIAERVRLCQFAVVVELDEYVVVVDNECLLDDEVEG